MGLPCMPDFSQNQNWDDFMKKISSYDIVSVTRSYTVHTRVEAEQETSWRLVNIQPRIFLEHIICQLFTKPYRYFQKGANDKGSFAEVRDAGNCGFEACGACLKKGSSKLLLNGSAVFVSPSVGAPGRGTGVYIASLNWEAALKLPHCCTYFHGSVKRNDFNRM